MPAVPKRYLFKQVDTHTFVRFDPTAPEGSRSQFVIVPVSQVPADLVVCHDQSSGERGVPPHKRTPVAQAPGPVPKGRYRRL